MDIQTPTPTTPLRGELRWEAPRHPVYERGIVWYAIGGTVVLAAAAYGILSGAWTLALVALLCGALYFLVRDHQLPNSTCVLTELGMELDGVFMPWSSLKGFWFLQTPSYTEIRFTPKTARASILNIQIGQQSPNEIRSFLSGVTTELTDQREGVLDTFSRFAKL